MKESEKMSKCSFIVHRLDENGRGRITGSNNGKPFAVETDHINYKKIIDVLKSEDHSALESLLDIPKSITKASNGKVTIVDEQVYYDGQVVDNYITKKIVQFLSNGLPFKPLMNFLSNVMLNPSKRAVEELYPFLERNEMPITDDGCFVGYKGVCNDWTDVYSGMVSYPLGAVVEMTRNLVDDNWMEACSSGYHVGSFEYANNFRGGGGRLLAVKVNPKDVVSVPDAAWKLRTCKLEVLEEITGLGLMTDVVYKYTEEDREIYEDEDYEDYEDYEDEEDADNEDVDEDEDEEDEDYCPTCGTSPCRIR